VVNVVIELKSCKECPYFKTANQWSSDGWDRMEDWICTKMNDKKIQGAVEWYEESKIKIPDWCPILVNEKLHISDVISSLTTTNIKVPKEFCQCKNPLEHDIQCPIGNDI
jgi:hypothetical protein